MNVGQALRQSRKERGVAQSELTPYGQTMVAKVEKGQRQVAIDVAPHLATKLDHPALYLELARELTGGYGPAWLDGPNVDLHRASVRERCLEELHEAMEAINKWGSSVPPAVETDRDRKGRYEHLMQCFDAIVALSTYVGVQCLEYGFSMLQLSKDHYGKLKGKRYVQA